MMMLPLITQKCQELAHQSQNILPNDKGKLVKSYEEEGKTQLKVETSNKKE